MRAHRSELVPAGPGHSRVRQYLDIKHNRSPDRDGALALEGLWAIQHATDAGVPIEALFVCPALGRGDGAETLALLEHVGTTGASAYEVSERVLRRMVDRDGPDGLAAIGRLQRHTLEDVPIGPRARVVIADGFELAGNVGTLIRCADGAGAAAVVLTDRKVRTNHPLVVKASMGTVFSMPLVDASHDEALAWARRRGVRIVAADPSARMSYRCADYTGAVAVVLGSERQGLAPFWREAADVTVSIPMLGIADSLNVGHAAALLLYEAVHQHDSRR